MSNLSKFDTFDSMKKPTAEQMKLAIAQASGNVSAAAQALGIHRATLHLHIKRSPGLASALETAREVILDELESVLVRKAREGNTPELLFYLKTQGRSRGYIERQEHVIFTPQQLEAMTDDELRAITDR